MRYDLHLKDKNILNLSVEMIRAASEVDGKVTADIEFTKQIEDLFNAEINLQASVLPDFRNLTSQEILKLYPQGKK